MPGLAGVSGSEKRGKLWRGGVGRWELSAKDVQETANVQKAPKAH